MVNLLPTDLKISRKYARQNRKLLLWLVFCGAGIMGLLAVAGGGFYFLQRAEQSQAKTNEQLSSLLAKENTDDKIKEFQNFSGQLQTVTSILDNQYLFSNLVRRLGGTIPPGAILTNVALTGEQRSLELIFRTTTNEVANQILVNLNDVNNGLFKQADTISISCTTPSDDSTTPTGGFNCQTTVAVLFFEDTDFVLLNALLTEQSVLAALNNTRKSVPAIEATVFESAAAEGIKDTIKVTQLHQNSNDAATTASILRSNDAYFYATTIKDESGATVQTSLPYFKSVTIDGTACPGNLQSTKEPSTTFNCQTSYTLVFHLDTSEKEKQEELKEKNGIDSLLNAFVTTHGESE